MFLRAIVLGQIQLRTPGQNLSETTPCLYEIVVDPKSEPKLSELQCEPLMFLSGAFTKSQLRWHIGQKELYPLVYMLKKYSHVLHDSQKTVNLYTDHVALKNIIAPKSGNKNHSARLSRWALLIQEIRLRVMTVTSGDNALCDLLTRWGADVL